MAGTIDITLADLEGQFNARQVQSVFSDDGSGKPGARLQTAISVARRLADGVMLAAWSEAQIVTLVAEDDAIRSAVLDLVMSEGMKGRLEWDTEGGPRDRLRKAGLENLKLLAQAQLRSVGESKAGVNPHVKAASARTERNPHTFVFAPSKARPVRGGF